MPSEIRFVRLVRQTQTEFQIAPAEDELTFRLTHFLRRRFEQPTNLSVTIVPGSFLETDAADAGPPPPHPECAPHGIGEHCPRAWRSHVLELTTHSSTHWRTCESGRRCGLVPVVHANRCVAAVRLVCAADVPVRDFCEHLEHLDLVVADFERLHRDVLERAQCAEAPPKPDPMEAAEADSAAVGSIAGEHVRAAIEYVERHFAERTLSVHEIAEHIGVHPNYLGSLFAQQTGQRLSQYVARRRLRRAIWLLRNSSASIKQVALRSGFSNSNWFSSVFTSINGCSPSEYRSLETCSCADA
ncbi:MAG: helix-turn-helix transcriptional regulator [Planctomycetes bacterium]|nr:helix-turn-helix transcriptional regulator [Planctomycetota bacterium]